MNILIGRAIFSFLISFLITLYLVPLFSSLAKKLQFVDVPDGVLKRHKSPVPYLGGVAIYCGFIAALALTFPWNNKILFFLIGSTLLLFVGLIDDLVILKPYQKFLGHIIAVFCYMKAGLYFKERFFYNFWNLAISFFWMLSIINAFNFVDVMDGLATSLAISATISFMIIAFLFGHYSLLILLGAFLGGLIAFFYYNQPPARIYLGDTGSLFIGGVLASVPFLFDWSEYKAYGYVVPIVFLAIPSLEITTLIIIRIYRGIPFYNGSPDHFSMLLLQKGWSKSIVLGYVFSLSMILLLVSLLFLFSFFDLVNLVGVGVIFIIIWFYTLFR